MQDELIRHAIREAGLDDGHPVSPLLALCAVIALHERERQREGITAAEVAALDRAYSAVAYAVRGPRGSAR